MTKTFGSIRTEMSLNTENLDHIHLTFELRRQPEIAASETLSEFEKNLFNAARWVLKCFHFSQEKGHAERLQELMSQFGDEIKAAGIDTD